MSGTNPPSEAELCRLLRVARGALVNVARSLPQGGELEIACGLTIKMLDTRLDEVGHDKDQ